MTTIDSMGSDSVASQDRVGPETATAPRQGIALLLCPDLMFAVQLQNMARNAGLKPVMLRPGAPIPGADLLVVDLGMRGEWEETVRDAASRGMIVVAFGPHMDAEGRRKAKTAGAGRVLANSNLTRDLPLIFKEIAECLK